LVVAFELPDGRGFRLRIRYTRLKGKDKRLHPAGFRMRRLQWMSALIPIPVSEYLCKCGCRKAGCSGGKDPQNLASCEGLRVMGALHDRGSN
jgi:hypothetical protein